MVTATANKKNRQGRQSFYLVFPVLLSPAVAWAQGQGWEMPSYLAPYAEALQIEPGGWEVTPRITASETYSDNVRLEPDSEKESDLITVIAPGIHASKNGGGVRAELDYELESVFPIANLGDSQLNHKLNGAGQFELKPDWFYLDALASYTQRNISQSGRLSLDTVTGSQELEDVGTLQISPYLQHDFGGQVETLARYTHEEIYYSGSNAAGSSTDSLDLSLASGRFWRVVNWSFNHNYSNIDRTSSDATFASTRGDVSYRLTDTFRLLARAGYEDNDYQTPREIENGGYVAAGALWRPSRFYALEALYGDKYSQGTLRLNPTRRTDLDLTYTEREVGTILGPSWDARLRHRGPAITLSGSYHEDTTNMLVNVAIPETLYLHPLFPLIRSGSCGDQLPGYFAGGTCTETDVINEIVERKRADGTIEYETGRSLIRARAFNERRLFLTSLRKERVEGTDVSLRWRYTGLTDVLLRGGTIDTLRGESTVEDELWFAEATVAHTFNPRTTGSVQVRHTTQESTLATNEYTENRLTVMLRMEF